MFLCYFFLQSICRKCYGHLNANPPFLLYFYSGLLTTLSTDLYSGLPALGTYLYSGLAALGTDLYSGLPALGTYFYSRLAALGTDLYLGLPALGTYFYSRPSPGPTYKGRNKK